jgi:hypothetical protein
MPRTSQPRSRTSAAISAHTALRGLSRTMPFQSRRPASNCGFMSAIRRAGNLTSANAGGKTFLSEMKSHRRRRNPAAR